MNSAKVFFKSLKGIDKRIIRKEEQLRQLREAATSTTPVIQDANIKPSGTSRPVEDNGSKIVDLEADIKADRDRLCDVRMKANRIIRSIPDKAQGDCLECVYIMGKTLDEAATELGYSHSGIRKLHGYALVSANKILDNDKNSDPK